VKFLPLHLVLCSIKCFPKIHHFKSSCQNYVMMYMVKYNIFFYLVIFYWTVIFYNNEYTYHQQRASTWILDMNPGFCLLHVHNNNFWCRINIVVRCGQILVIFLCDGLLSWWRLLLPSNSLCVY
jgi:hypothetical protein